MCSDDLKGCRLEEGRLLQFGQGRIVVDEHITKNNKSLESRPFARFFFDQEVKSWERFASGLKSWETLKEAK